METIKIKLLVTPNPVIETRLRVQEFDVHKEFTKIEDTGRIFYTRVAL